MLHIVNKSPLERPALDACLRIAEPGAILLIEDAVYAATSAGAGWTTSTRNTTTSSPT